MTPGRTQRGEWDVPRGYSLVEDVIDRHARDVPAMLWADATGAERTVAWGEIQDQSCQIARLLIQREISTGDVVAVVMPQTVEAACACVGVLRAGAALLCLSPLWSEDELLRRLRAASCRAVIADPATSARLSSGSDLTLRPVVPTPAVLAEVDASHIRVQVPADAPAHVYFTSGTTGPPKALVHAQRNILGHNEFEVCHALSPGDVFYGAGEWAWSQAKLLGPWRLGAVQFVFSSQRLDPNRLFAAISRAGVTSALLNPSMLKITRAKLAPDTARLPWAFRSVCSSNEPIPPELSAWFERTFGCPIREYYGLTESYPMVGYRASERVRPGSTGRPLPGWHVELHDEDGKPTAAGHVGEARLKAASNPQYPLGYLRSGRIDSTRFDGEWFATGDTFRCDDDGYWYFIGRNDDVIKTSGYRIGPYEVENALESHPAVAAAAVVGVPDAARGQLVRAHVVRTPEGLTGDPAALVAELQEWVKRKHSPFSYPRQIVFVSDLPRSSTGKIQRALLRNVQKV